MKKTIVLFLSFTTIIFAQTIDKNAIQKLMLESKYSQVITILENKESNNEELSYSDQFYLAISYQRLVNHNKAIGILVSMSKSKKDDTSVLFAMGESYRALGNNRGATGIYNEVIERDSSNTLARIELARLYIEMKNYDSATKIYSYLVLQDSSNAYYLREYGYSLYRLGFNKDAEQHLGKALEINKFDPKTALWLSKIYFDNEKYSEALMLINESLNYNPVYLPLNKLKAEALYKMQLYNSAANQYQNLITLGDSTSAVFQKLGLCLYSYIAGQNSLSESEKADKIQEAIEAFERSNILDNYSNPLTLTYLGFCFKTLERYKTAIVYLEKALEAMTPEYTDRVYSNLGACYERTNNYSEAIKAFSKSLEYSSENPSTIFRLAAVYDRFYEDKSVALAHYKKYLKKADYLNDETTVYSENRIEKLEEYMHFRGK
jgi:tetratricopeptide (TPR) repeat protein